MDLCWKVMSLFYNMLSKFIIAFLPRSKHLLLWWLQSPSAVILKPKKIKSLTVSNVLQIPTRSPSNVNKSKTCHSQVSGWWHWGLSMESWPRAAGCAKWPRTWDHIIQCLQPMRTSLDYWVSKKIPSGNEQSSSNRVEEQQRGNCDSMSACLPAVLLKSPQTQNEIVSLLTGHGLPKAFCLLES